MAYETGAERRWGGTAYHAADACHCAKCEQAGQSGRTDYSTAQQGLIRRKLQVGHCKRTCDSGLVVDFLKWAREMRGRAGQGGGTRQRAVGKRVGHDTEPGQAARAAPWSSFVTISAVARATFSYLLRGADLQEEKFARYEGSKITGGPKGPPISLPLG